MRLTVFGLGYVGSVTAAALSRDGHEVVGVDVSKPKIEAMRAGHSPVLEPGVGRLIETAVRAGRLRATGDVADGLSGSELSLICVGTPSSADGGLDLSHVREVAAQIGAHLDAAAPDHLIVVRSTVLPGTTRGVVLPEVERASGRRAGDGFDVSTNPEFLREGSSLADYDNPNRILVGERAPGVGRRAVALYERVEAPLFVTSLEVAEAVKYTDNAFHALKIGFSNEVARVCQSLGVDGAKVMEIVARDEKLNASPAYLRPGFAFGGSCLPKDLRALTYAARQAAVHAPLLEAILPSNELRIRRALEEVLATGRRRAALLGLAFKPGTDDLRESPLVELAERLLGKGFDLTIYDSAVELGRIHGSNRDYLEQKLPHIGRLLSKTLEQAVRDAEIVIIGHADRRFDRADEWRAHGKIVIELT